MTERKTGSVRKKISRTTSSIPSKISRTFRKKENVSKRIGNTKRNLTLDSDVHIAWVYSKKDGSVVGKVVTKSVTQDRLMLTDVIYDECIKQGDKRKAPLSRGGGNCKQA
jgi:hypothetical protein